MGSPLPPQGTTGRAETETVTHVLVTATRACRAYVRDVHHDTVLPFLRPLTQDREGQKERWDKKEGDREQQANSRGRRWGGGGTEKEEDERGAQEVSGREQGTPGRVESPPQDWCETQGIRRGS